jgi:phage portal protein BeeE
LIGSIVSTLPCSFFREADAGGQEAPEDHAGQYLVESAANPWTSAGELRLNLTIDAMLAGNGYALVVRDADGNPVELHRLLPATVITTIDPRGEPKYTYDGKTTARVTCWSFVRLFAWTRLAVSASSAVGP